MNKTTFHKRAKMFLRGLAVNTLGLSEGQFEIRAAHGGPAVLGETVLHTDPVFNGKGLYVMVGDFRPIPKPVMMRTCTSRKDYVGGHNNFLTWEEALTMAKERWGNIKTKYAS